MFTTVLGANNVDVILGFSAADDTILLENNGVFVGLAGGTLNSNAFVIDVAAQESATGSSTISHRPCSSTPTAPAPSRRSSSRD